MGLASTAVVRWQKFATGSALDDNGPATRVLSLDRDWLFEGPSQVGGDKQGETAFSRISLPHCVAKLSWQNWDPAAWERLWNYRRHFTLPKEFRGLRLFVHFDGVMVGASPSINGHQLPSHLGGYLPFEYELTPWLKDNNNILEVVVDSRWSNVPPEGSPAGPKRIDYLEAGGIYRSVCLKAVPEIFISDVFARPIQVLDSNRRIEMLCRIDAAALPAKPIYIQAELRRGPRVVSRVREQLQLEKPGSTECGLMISNLGNVALWTVDTPHLYEIVTTLFVENKAIHDHRIRIGLRDARFEINGFFLNGNRLQIFGLNRHEVYPYVGGAMPARIMRRDAEIIRRAFNCNMVRCSHYPQSEAFLNACDELGLMVWEEIAGWSYLGDDAWKQLLVRDVHDMLIRDRNHPSIVIWGVRVNESANDMPLYRRTTELAKSLDPSRPASGSMTPDSRRNWQQDWHEEVFAFDDYHSAPDRSVGIDDPVPGVPYLVTEAVGQFDYAGGRDFGSKYRHAGDVHLQQQQAVRHAQAHDRAAGNPRISGVIAWSAFDYASLINSHNGVKCPGVADFFRISKLGASFYLAQIDPQIRPIIQPNFYWDFGSQTPKGPGNNATVFSNCHRLELFIDGRPHSTLFPDSTNFPNLKYPPFWANLELDGAGHPELRIDGYIGQNRILSRSFSSDTAQDRFLMEADDEVLVGDGVDATRLVFKVVDKFGAERLFAGGVVGFEIAGPGAIVGDNPFSLKDSGGVGAIWIRTGAESYGRIRVTGRHSGLGARSVEIKVRSKKET